MKPLNNYLVCKDVEDNKATTDSGFEVATTKRFKDVEIVASSQDDVQVGDIAKISVSSGEPDGENLIIRRQDIIYIK